MHQNMSKPNHLLPWNFRVQLSKFFGYHIRGLSYDFCEFDKAKENYRIIFN